MVISFINYEIRVNLEKKNQDDVAREDQQIQQRTEQLRQTANLAGTMPATTPGQLQEETKIEPDSPVVDEPANTAGAAVDQ